MVDTKTAIQNGPAVVLYSGGADSTMTAFLVGKQHLPLHLVSFKHRYMSQTDKSSVNVKRLRAIFGEDSVIHTWIDMDPLWRVLTSAKYSTFKEWGLFNIVIKSCVSCKAAMHLSTLNYCEQHQIKLVADGAHPSGAHLFPEQSREGIEFMHGFYESHGIGYQNPVYNIERPDFELFQQGVTEKQNTKDEHLYYSNQFACNVGLFAYFYYFGIRPFDPGKSKINQKTVAYMDNCMVKQIARVNAPA
jgi:7-cyano-7-deazaguanine synthase in queuosine biosynthesis